MRFTARLIRNMKPTESCQKLTLLNWKLRELLIASSSFCHQRPSQLVAQRITFTPHFCGKTHEPRAELSELKPLRYPGCPSKTCKP